MRRGMGKGQGMGYKNIVPRDPYIHGLSAKGVKTFNAKYDINMSLRTESELEPRQIIGEAIDDWNENYDQNRSTSEMIHSIEQLSAKGQLDAKMTAQELEKNLSMFTGTEQYHKLSFMPLLATDGVAYLMENAESYWLFDAIASYQGKMAKEPFQVWILEVKDNKAVLKGYRDYSEKNPKKYKPLVTQKIGYTDFPLKKVKIWVENGVALLPSEH